MDVSDATDFTDVIGTDFTGTDFTYIYFDVNNPSTA